MHSQVARRYGRSSFNFLRPEQREDRGKYGDPGLAAFEMALVTACPATASGVLLWMLAFLSAPFCHGNGQASADQARGKPDTALNHKGDGSSAAYLPTAAPPPSVYVKICLALRWRSKACVGEASPAGKSHLLIRHQGLLCRWHLVPGVTYCFAHGISSQKQRG
ncbi:unnamed protein product [Diplocarpon coronariae]